MHRSRSSNLPLHALRAFEAASRLKSFKLAAAELAVTPAAISHQIKGLETQLGVLLFERLHRSLRITPAGTRLSEVARSAFSALERALDELIDDGLAAGARTLNVSAAPSLAAKWLAPRIHRFQALHPNIELRLSASDVLVDLTNRREVDVALRYGRGPYGPDIQAEPMWSSGKMVVVCSPKVLAKGSLRKPADLLNFSLIRTATPRPAYAYETATPLGWQAWLAAAGVVGEQAQVAAVSGPLFGSSQLALEAAATGQGIALAPLILVRDDLRSGRLCRPFETTIGDPCFYWLLFNKERAEENRIRSFVRWVLDEAAMSPVE